MGSPLISESKATLWFLPALFRLKPIALTGFVGSFQVQKETLPLPLIPSINTTTHTMLCFLFFPPLTVKDMEPLPTSAIWAVLYSRILMEAIFWGMNWKIYMLMGYYYTIKYICPRRPLCSQWRDGNVPMCWTQNGTIHNPWQSIWRIWIINGG